MGQDLKLNLKITVSSNWNGHQGEFVFWNCEFIPTNENQNGGWLKKQNWWICSFERRIWSFICLRGGVWMLVIAFSQDLRLDNNALGSVTKNERLFWMKCSPVDCHQISWYLACFFLEKWFVLLFTVYHRNSRWGGWYHQSWIPCVVDWSCIVSEGQICETGTVGE
jgi:hypothetical protein